MSLQPIFRRAAAASFAAACLFAAGASAQNASDIAAGNNVYCAGYVQTAAVDTSRRIVGAYNEQDGHIFSEGNVVYLNAGASQGVKVGDLMSVSRPRGTVNSKVSRRGDLGFYVEEVGSVEVIRVKADSSVARVKTSCDNFLLGDLVQPLQLRPVPAMTDRPALDRYGDANGKAVGRLFMARGNLEMLSAQQIVYVDLGREDNVAVGDYMTVFRPLGKGNPYDRIENESVAARNVDFQSFEYKGGEFSNMAARKSGDHARGRVVTTSKAKNGRGDIRKVVGEVIILSVRERTATAMITRTAQELHTGDYVEVQ